jgi:hypothetical protein
VEIAPILSLFLDIPGGPMLDHSPQTGETDYNVRTSRNKGKNLKQKRTYNGIVK